MSKGLIPSGSISKSWKIIGGSMLNLNTKVDTDKFTKYCICGGAALFKLVAGA